MSREKAIALLRNPPRYFYVIRRVGDFIIIKDNKSAGVDGPGLEIVDEYEDYKVAVDKCADMQADALLEAVVSEVVYVEMSS